MRILKINFALYALIIGLFLTASAQAATVTVNSTNDPGNGVCDVTECTLREAIAAANAGDTIDFSALFDTARTITLSGTLDALIINKNLTITGKGASLMTVRRNSATTGAFRIFEINSAATVSISGLTVTGARKTNANGTVRAIVVQPDGKIIIGGDFTTVSPNGDETGVRYNRLFFETTLDKTAVSLAINRRILIIVMSKRSI